VICEYCGRRRDFDAVDVDALFAASVPTPSQTIH
jgi:hypothetical protein